HVVDAAALALTAVAAFGAGAADRPVAGEGALAHGEGGPDVPDATADAQAARDAGPAGAAEGLVVAEGAVTDRQRAAVGVRDAAAPAHGERTDRGTALDPVAGEGAGANGQGAAIVEDAAAEGILTRLADGLVVGHHDADQGQITASIPDAAAVV